MDVFERLNRKFGVWYEGLFGGADGQDLRPRDILRRILAAMEDGRREGLDGQVYVPNVYTLQIAVESDDERGYLRTFLDADELAAAVARAAEQRGYQIRGMLSFTVEEMDAPKAAVGGGAPDRVRIQCRFENEPKAANTPAVSPAAPALVTPAAAKTPPAVETVAPPEWDEEDSSEPGTVAAIPKSTLASLVVRSADGTLQDVYPLTVHGARVGRGRQAGNDIILTADGMISKSHVIVDYDANANGGGRFTVRDDNSTNGTSLNGECLAPGRAYPLTSGDELKLGQTLLVFRAAEQSPPTMPAPIVSAPVAPVVPVRPDRPFRLIAGDGEPYPLASTMTVGRALTSDIVVIGNGVAGQHARLTVRADAVYVEDLRTAGGTTVNGERIPSDFPVALYEGDQIAFGETMFRLARGRAA